MVKLKIMKKSKKKDDERNEQIREMMLKNLNKDGNNVKKNDLKVSVKREKVIIKDNNTNKNKNTNSNTNKNKNKNKNTNANNPTKRVLLNIQLTDDAGKKGISLKSFEKIDLQYQYSYGKVYKVKLKDNNDININDNNDIKKNETFILKK